MGLALSFLMAGMGSSAQAQLFFGDLGDGMTVGVDLGATALLPEVTAATRYFSSDTYGSSSIGPDIMTLSIAHPGPMAGAESP